MPSAFDIWPPPPGIATDQCVAMVIATGLYSPMERIGEVEALLRDREVPPGRVVFDMAMCQSFRGNKTLRYIAVVFDGSRFPTRKMEMVYAKDLYAPSSAAFFRERAGEVLRRDSSESTRKLVELLRNPNERERLPIHEA